MDVQFWIDAGGFLGVELIVSAVAVCLYGAGREVVLWWLQRTEQKQLEVPAVVRRLEAEEARESW